MSNDGKPRIAQFIQHRVSLFKIKSSLDTSKCPFSPHFFLSMCLKELTQDGDIKMPLLRLLSVLILTVTTVQQCDIWDLEAPLGTIKQLGSVPLKILKIRLIGSLKIINNNGIDKNKR